MESIIYTPEYSGQN